MTNSSLMKVKSIAECSLNESQKYCRMLLLEHSAILLTFIKLPFSIYTFVLYIFEWPLKTGFTVVVLVSVPNTFRLDTTFFEILFLAVSY